MATVKRRRPDSNGATPEQQSHASDSTGNATRSRRGNGGGQERVGKVVTYDLTDVSVVEAEREPDGPPEPLPSAAAIRQRTRDLLRNWQTVAALQRRYGLTVETLREFEIGLELQRRDGPWISIPIRDEGGRLVNVRRRYFGRKAELRATGRKYRNLTGRSEARLY